MKTAIDRVVRQYRGVPTVMYCGKRREVHVLGGGFTSRIWLYRPMKPESQAIGVREVSE